MAHSIITPGAPPFIRFREAMDFVTFIVATCMLYISIISPIVVAVLIIQERWRPGPRSRVSDLYSRLVGANGKACE